MATAPSAWALGLTDKLWGARLTPPEWPAWAEDKPVRLQPLTLPTADPDPTAIAGDGMLRADTQAVRLRFVEGRPVSPVTTAFLTWVCDRLRVDGQQALLLLWDNASWHLRQDVRGGIRAYNRPAKQSGGVRIVVCQLPIKSPWLNRIELHWIHAKRAIAEPGGLLSKAELINRICADFNCQDIEHLQPVIAKKVA